MKKTKYLALVLVAAIALMGAGYAWWTDTLIASSTVNTGYLDVDFTSYGHEASSQWVKVANHYITQLENDGEDYPYGSRDKAVLVINDMYPGSSVTQTLTLTNVGTMPVNLSQMIITATGGNADTLAKMNITVDGTEFDDFAEQNGIQAASLQLDSFGHHNPAHGRPGHRCWPGCPGYEPPVDPDPDPETKYTLNPGESTEIEIVYALDESAENDITENKQVTFELTINATQYNYEAQ